MRKDLHQWTVEDKIGHLEENIVPGLKDAFKRGDRRFTGAKNFGSGLHLTRSPEEDIAHVTRCHIDVRLAEAEDEASMGDLEAALKKIESAIGYAIILHARLSRDK